MFEDSLPSSPQNSTPGIFRVGPIGDLGAVFCFVHSLVVSLRAVTNHRQQILACRFCMFIVCVCIFVVFVGF